MVAIASLTAMVAATSLTAGISRLLALRSGGVTRARVRFPNGKQVAFWIVQLGKPPHSRYRALAHKHLGPETLGLADEIVHALDADVIDRGLVGIHAAHESAVHARFGGTSLGIGWHRLHHPIFEVLVPGFHPFTRALEALDIPAEQLPIELGGPLGIVRRNLEMHDRVCHRDTSFSNSCQPCVLPPSIHTG